MSDKILSNSLFETSFKRHHDSINAEKLSMDHAVVFAAIPDATCLDYVKSVANAIGSRHIHSVYMDGPQVNVYLKEKKYVESVINQGVFVKGCLMNVDFLVPPASKVVISNVDPIIPNKILLCLLGCYGTFESALIRQKISVEEGYAHIESSSRVIYMKITEGKTIPKKLPLVYGNCLYEISVTVEKQSKIFRHSASQTE